MTKTILTISDYPENSPYYDNTNKKIIGKFKDAAASTLIVEFVGLKGRTIIFFIEGITIFGTCRQFFLKSNAFQTIFFITFCNENNFFTTIFKKRYRLFIDLI